MSVDPQRSGTHVDLRDRSRPSDQIATTVSRRLETLWVEANRQVDREDLDPGAAQSWVEALDHLTLALQALEDVGSPPSRTWGHRAWYDRRPG